LEVIMRAPALLLAAFVMIGAESCATKSTLPPALPRQASMPFGRSDISTWAVTNDHTIYIQSINRQWYKADLMGACIDLPFAEHIGFEFNPDGSFDRFSSIVSHGQNCPLVSLTTTVPPAGYEHKHIQVAKEAQAAPMPEPNSTSAN